MIAAAAFALATLALAWLAAGVPQAFLFFGSLSCIYAGLWFITLPRPRRVRTDWRYCTPHLVPEDELSIIPAAAADTFRRRLRELPESESEARYAHGDR